MGRHKKGYVSKRKIIKFLLPGHEQLVTVPITKPMNKKPKQNNNDEIPSNQQQNLNQTQHVQNASLQGHEDTSSFSNSVTANFEYDFELFGSPYSSNVIPDFMDADLALALELFLDNNCLGPNSTANSSHVDNEDEDEEC